MRTLPSVLLASALLVATGCSDPGVDTNADYGDAGLDTSDVGVDATADADTGSDTSLTCADIQCDSAQTCHEGSCYEQCDETDDCADEQRCHDFRCISTSCDTVECDTDRECYRGVCYPACNEDSDCEDGLSCTDDACVDPCEQVVCDDRQSCYRGVCYANCNPEAPCQDDQGCRDGQCRDGCEDLVCRDDETCYRGVCYPACTEPDDCDQQATSCLDNACIADPCEGLECFDDDCHLGICVGSCNDHDDCGDDAHCADGSCAPLSCEEITCPETETCLGGVCYPACDEDSECEEADACLQGACVDPNCEDGLAGGGLECPDLLADALEISNIEETSATFTAQFDPPPITAENHGFCWHTQPDPAADDEHCESLGKPQNRGPFSLTATGLDPDTEYFVQSFVTTAEGVHYTSDTVSFGTLGPPVAAESSITSSDTPLADGQETAEIDVELRDQFGNPVPGESPEFVAEPELGNEYLGCSASGDDGTSTCEMTSTISGPKTLELTAPVELQDGTVEFLPFCDSGDAPFGGGDGTDANPYRICAPDHLVNISDDETDAHLLVKDDIDMTGDAPGFDSIGSGGAFDGVFDGNGHEIELPSPSLFADIGPDGLVDRVEVSGLDIDATTYSGGFADHNEGTIRRVRIAVTVEGGSAYIGGLVGENTGTIQTCRSDADTFGGSNTGGLVAQNDGEISGSAATGAIQQHTGGIAAINDGTISNSFATGENESSSGTTAGLVLYNGGEVSDSWAAVADTNSGLVFSNDGGDVTDSYWDEDVSGTTDSQGGQPLTTDEFADQQVFEPEWNFDGVWVIDTAPDGEPRPVLQWMD